MTAEAKLLVPCCRRFFRTDQHEALDEIARGLNWDAAISLAEAHSVLPVVYSVLKQDGRAIIPEALSCRFEANARHNLALTAELLKLLSLLADAGIKVIPLKGPLLAFQAYGDLGLRSFSDLDLLVSPADVPRAWRVLAANDYRMQWTLPSSGESAYLKVKEQQLSFVQSNGTAAVDLHWGLLPDYCGGASACEEALKRAESVTIGGRSVRSLASADLLLYLCAHGGKHLWTRLGWICDVAGIIRSRPEIEWGRVLEEAARHDAVRTVSVGLLLAEGVLGVALPAGITRSIRSDLVARKLASDIQERMFSETPVGLTSLEACRVNLRMIQGFTNKLRYFAGIFFTPGEAEFRVLRLPGPLYPLYYPFRMARMVAKYGWGKREVGISRRP